MRPRLLRALIACSLIVAGVSTPALASNDAYSSRLWGLKKVGGETAWSTGRGAGMTVAIVDSGIDLKHEDLRSNLVAGYDFVADDADPSDEHGHGTHVAGIAAARANNDVGVAGVAPDAKIMPIRVLNEEGRGSLGDIDDGVRWAVAHGADVVNLSLGDNVVIENLSGGVLTDVVEYAWSKGVIPVISSGNDAFFRTELRDARTILVTATTPDDTKAYYATSVGFARWGMAAPGGTDEGGKENMIYSTFWSPKGAHYSWAMGTSMAAPHVAGAAAILRGLGLTPQQTVDRLLSTAKDIGGSGDDFTFGHGRLDVAAAVAGLGKSAPSTAMQTTSPKTVDGTPAGAATDAPRSRGSAPAAASTSAPGDPSASPKAEDTLRPSPTVPVLATDDIPDRSRGPGLLIAGLVLASAAALAGYGGFLKWRARA